jgi:hypothetical protein
VVVIAGRDHDLTIRSDRRAQFSQWSLGNRERVAEGPVAQFEHVPEQHQPVTLGGGAQQRLAVPGLTENVTARVGTEMQVGDDQRAQR